MKAATREKRRLGKLLVDRGWITSEQLLRAIEHQKRIDGRLGTALLEMDALPEDLLLRALGEQYGLPAAGADDLRNIPETVYGLVPARLARRCQAVPFRLLGTELSVALLDAENLTAQDELAFATGKRLRIHVANEARIFEALEKYYGEECPMHIAHILDRLNRARYLWDRDREDAPLGPAEAHPLLAEMPLWDEAPLLGEPELPERLADPPLARAKPPARASIRPVPEPSPKPPAAAPAPPQPAVDGEGELATRVFVPSPPLPAPPAAAITEAPPPAPAPTSFAEVETRLEAANDRDSIGRTLIAFLGGRFARVGLLIVRGDRIFGWMGAGEGFDPAVLSAFSAGFNQPSIFLNLRQSGPYYLGALPPMPAHRELMRAWAASPPAECLILPVRLRDRLVCLIYLDDAGASLAGFDLEEMLRLSAKTAIAFELCIMRKKLRNA